jgi:molecular chaperone GrpE
VTNRQDDEKLPDASDSADEPSGGALPASDELEAALRAATESVEALQAERGGSGSTENPGAGSADGAASADKVLLEALSEELQSGKQQFDELTKERDDLQDKLLRLQAEFENFRRRGLKERQEAHNFGHQNLVKDLLPTVDNLERAIAHSSESAEGSGGEDLQALLQGIELVQRELLGVLGKYGVSKIEAESKPFDPAYHEAMTQIVDDSVASGTVIQVLEEGYQLRDRMLRPTRVVVSKQSEDATPEPETPPREEESEESE